MAALITLSSATSTCRFSGHAWADGAGRWPAWRAVLRQVRVAQGNGAYIVGVHHPITAAALRRVRPSGAGDDARTGPCRIVGEVHRHGAGGQVGCQRAAVESQRLSQSIMCCARLRFQCAHVDSRRTGAEGRTVGQRAGHGFQRNLQGEAAAQAGFADHLRLPVHELAQPFADRQAQAGTGLAGGIFGLVERVEQCCCCAWEMPTPESLTCQSRSIRPSRVSRPRRRRTTRPLSVNLIALLSRLLRIWRIRSGSPHTLSGRFASMQAYSCKPLERANAL